MGVPGVKVSDDGLLSNDRPPIHRVTREELIADMGVSASGWKSRAKYYEALWRSALRDLSMCADHVKGDVDVSFAWDDGTQGDLPTMHSDYAEKRLRAIAVAAVFHALTRDAATVTLTVKKRK